MAKKKTNEELLEELNSLMGSFVSRKQTFIRGIIGGVGTAIGATVIAGIVLIIGAKIITTLQIPILDEIVKDGKIQVETK